MLKLPSKFLQQHGSKIRDGLTVLKLVSPEPRPNPNPNSNPNPKPNLNPKPNWLTLSLTLSLTVTLTFSLILTLTRSPASADAPGCRSTWGACPLRWSRWRIKHVKREPPGLLSGLGLGLGLGLSG